ncbi:hypothetical protein MKK64_03060 [Methylobacterium sp. E-025]|uniref:reverse transcriptase domain-containing protein n=1 Tax=Methylobacterium sp. E-025 TaxID=2836561 RepID=UPI001FBBC7C0|nr:reverse transcriptase domain-containing protein [Methylobacterium sp. E-025]MCJ2110201.1 hypothetical protein [Methylobacterium sp. E-025]
MTRSKFQDFVRRDAIRVAWNDFWKRAQSQRATGIDGVAPIVFKQKLEPNLERIYGQLREGYTFQALRPVAIEKSNGAKRIICIATVQDRVVQRLLSNHLTKQAEELGITNNISYGFVKSVSGRSRGVQAARAAAIELRQTNQWVYKTDIVSFFDRIERGRLINSTVRALKAPSFRRIISGVVSCEIAETDAAINRVVDANGIKRGVGLRQGMPLSPLLSNVALSSFDHRITRLGYKMVRYADDLIVLSSSQEQCLEIDGHVRSILRDIGHTIPPIGSDSKTQIAEPGQPIDFLGLSLQRTGERYELVVTEKQIEKIVQTINDYKDIGRLVREGMTFTKLGAKLDSTIGGYLAAYSAAQNVEHLSKIMLDRKRNVIRSILSRAFGEDSIRKLTSQSKAFMGIDID